MCFGIISVTTLVLMVWVCVKVPAFAGRAQGKHLPLRQVFSFAGIRPVLFVVLTFVLAHNIFYTYITPILTVAGMDGQTDVILLVFGLASVLGIWMDGTLIDKYLRRLTLLSTLLFTLSACVLALASDFPTAIYPAVAAWGLSFGGSATLFQTAIARSAGDAADIAQSMLVTAWNLAIAGGGILGGVLLKSAGVVAFSPAVIILLVSALAVILSARLQGFPKGSP